MRKPLVQRMFSKGMCIFYVALAILGIILYSMNQDYTTEQAKLKEKGQKVKPLITYTNGHKCEVYRDVPYSPLPKTEVIEEKDKHGDLYVHDKGEGFCIGHGNPKTNKDLIGYLVHNKVTDDVVSIYYEGKKADKVVAVNKNDCDDYTTIVERADNNGILDRFGNYYRFDPDVLSFKYFCDNTIKFGTKYPYKQGKSRAYNPKNYPKGTLIQIFMNPFDNNKTVMFIDIYFNYDEVKKYGKYDNNQ